VRGKKMKLKRITCKLEKIFFITLFLLLISSVSRATRYYVDSTNGHDSNEGTSEAIPWKTISKVNRSQFQPGDFILFSCGGIWREQLNIPSSGSIALPIHFSAFGDGNKPIINGSDLVTNWYKEVTTTWRTEVSKETKYVFFDNIQGNHKESLENVSSLRDWYYDSNKKVLYIHSSIDPTINYRNPGIEVTQRDCAINTNAQKYLVVENLNLTKTHKSNLFGLGGSHVIIQACDFSYGRGGGIKFWTSSNKALDITDIIINNNSLSDFNNHAIDIAADQRAIDNIALTNNYIGITKGKDHAGIMIYPYNGGTSSGDFVITDNILSDIAGIGIAFTSDDTTPGIAPNTIIIANNTISDWSKDVSDVVAGDAGAIHVINANNGKWTIENNTIYNGKGGFLSAGIYVDTFFNTSVTLSYNYIYNSYGAGLMVHRADDVVCAYNVVKNCGLRPHESYKSATILVSGWSGDTTNGNEFYNNILYQDQPIDTYSILIFSTDGKGTLSGNIFKNNIIYHDANRGYGYIRNTKDFSAIFDYNCYYPTIGTGEMNYTGTKYHSFSAWQKAGFDENGIESDPLFSNISKDEFMLKSKSQCIDAGLNVGLTKDFTGTVVPQGDRIDIGAFEYKRYSPVKNLRIAPGF
jgi:hypothetical protein